jgi:hypothetical protein
MRNLLALVGALVVGFAALGWYLGWYKVNVNKSSDGNIQIETKVDTNKVVKDTNEGAKHVGELLGSQIDKASAEAKAGPQPTPPVTTPGPLVPEKRGSWLIPNLSELDQK